MFDVPQPTRIVALWQNQQSSYKSILDYCQHVIYCRPFN